MIAMLERVENSIITMVTTAQSFKQKPFYPVTQKHAQLWTLYKAAWIGEVKGAGAEWGVASGARAPNLLGLLKFFNTYYSKIFKTVQCRDPRSHRIGKKISSAAFSLSPLRQAASSRHTHHKQSYIATPPANHSALHSHASCQSLSIT